VSARAGTGAGAALDGALRAMALGRLLVGAVARLSPNLTSILSGQGPSPGPEYDYMTRVFGARAIALGGGYLLAEGDARSLWQRLALFCDVADTVEGIALVRRRELPPPARAWLPALTATYAAIGTAKLVRDMSGG
jgi:hypothetical protein